MPFYLEESFYNRFYFWYLTFEYLSNINIQQSIFQLYKQTKRFACEPEQLSFLQNTKQSKCWENFMTAKWCAWDVQAISSPKSFCSDSHLCHRHPVWKPPVSHLQLHAAKHSKGKDRAFSVLKVRFALTITIMIYMYTHKYIAYMYIQPQTHINIHRCILRCVYIEVCLLASVLRREE